jgi:hypothetical protein
MQNYRRNGLRQLGGPLMRILDEADTGMSRPNSVMDCCCCHRHHHHHHHHHCQHRLTVVKQTDFHEITVSETLHLEKVYFVD